MTAPFSLAALLRLRRLQHDQAAAEVSTSRARAAELAARRRFAENSLARLMSSDGAAESLHWAAAARAASSSALGELSVLEEVTQGHLVESQSRLAETRAQAISLEKLEARHDEATRKDELRREQNLLDEIPARTAPPTRGKGTS